MSSSSSINLGNVALGRKLLDELTAKGTQVPHEFVQVQEMLEACERNSLQVAANIADARREKSQARLKGNEALLKEQNDLFEKIAAVYNGLAATDEWTKK